MDDVIPWVVFAGAWLLVAGPLYQGAIELNELEVDREGMAAISKKVPRPQLPSAWWWLLPPVMYVLSRRRNQANQRAIFAAMTPTQREQFISFKNKAGGWLTVAFGATLLAFGETWEIVKDHEWPLWVFWLVIVVMLAVAAINTTVRMIGNDHVLRNSATPAAPTTEPG